MFTSHPDAGAPSKFTFQTATVCIGAEYMNRYGRCECMCVTTFLVIRFLSGSQLCDGHWKLECHCSRWTWMGWVTLSYNCVDYGMFLIATRDMKKDWATLAPRDLAHLCEDKSILAAHNIPPNHSVPSSQIHYFSSACSHEYVYW